MKAPQFLRLVQIDELRYITACRHGLIHINWERATIRLSRDDFRRLAGLLERAMDAPPPAVMLDGEMSVTYLPDKHSELRLGFLALFLSPQEFCEFTSAAREAVRQLDIFLASGIWSREQPEDDFPSIWANGIRNPYSIN